MTTIRLGERRPIVGRKLEWQLLRDAHDRTISGQGGLVLLSGEAGVGKTTLATAICHEAAASGMLVLTGGCYDLMKTPPYGPWVEVTGSYPADDGLPELPEQLRAGGGLAGIDSQEALFDLARRFMSSVADTLPVVTLLEDLHWADPASLDLLRYLSRTLADEPVLLIATYRDDEIARDHPLLKLLPALVREGRVARLQLQRLDREAVLAIVRERYRLVPRDEARLLDYLHRLAEGNPFFTNELLYTLEGQRLLNPTAGGWKLGDLAEVGVPKLVQHVIEVRLARLGSAPRSVLDLAAVIGYEVPLDLLSNAFDGSTQDLDIALQQLIDHHLLHMGTAQRAVAFTHALVHQAIYNEISLLQRQTLHRRVGDLLASRARPESATVAGHFYAAGDERGLDWLVRSAEQARQLFAPAAVIDECQRGFDLAGQLNTDAPLGLRRLRGLARELLGDYQGAREDLEAALERARELGDQRAEWLALLDLASLWASRDYQQTREYCERAVDLARTMKDRAPLGQSLNRLGNWHANAEQAANALPYHEEALEIFEELQDVRGIGNTLDLLGIATCLYGDIPQAGHYLTRAIPLLRQVGDREILHSALMYASIGPWGGWPWRVARMLTSTSSYAEIEAQQQEALGIAREIGWRSGIAYAMGGIGLRAAAYGELRAALQYLSAGLAEAESIQHHVWIAQIKGLIGLTFVDLLISDAARENLQVAVDIARTVRSSYFEVGSAGLLASALIQQGRNDEVEPLLARYVEISEPPTMASVRHCWFAYAELALAEKRYQDALDITDRLIASIPDSPGLISPHLTRLRGEILMSDGRLDEAERQLAEAESDAARLGFPLILWRILATRSRLYLAQGRADKATAAGSAALEIINDLSGQFDDEMLRTTFLRNSRAQVPGAAPYLPDRVSFAGLTPREIEVLKAIADGLTDGETGERLFISTRTVSHHLGSIYNKLDVNNRAAAVRVAMQQGLI